MSTCSGHTHTRTGTLPIHLGGVDNHKDLLNGAGRSSLYQVLLYRPHDRWDCHDGWGWGAEGPTTLWIELKPQNELQRRARQGCHLVWWTPQSCRGGDEWANAFILTALNKKGRGKVRYTLPAEEDDAWQDSRLSSHTKLVLVRAHDRPPRWMLLSKKANKRDWERVFRSVYHLLCVILWRELQSTAFNGRVMLEQN